MTGKPASDIIEAKAQRDIELIDVAGERVVLAQGCDYEVHVGEPDDRLCPCEIYRLGGSEIVATVDRHAIRALLADGALI